MRIVPDKDWFVKWFDSPYYHLLYKHRDTCEAEMFLRNLLKHIALGEKAEILDLACGKGRHASSLHSMGFSVTGIDLSPESIAEASKMEDDTLKFMVADMRHFSFGKRFDCILNLFTSFGYFESLAENEEVIRRVQEHLLPGGIFVLDYFNAGFVRRQLPSQTETTRNHVRFAINKYADDGYVIKEIHITDGEVNAAFAEKVQLLPFDAIREMLEKAGLRVIGVYGDYQLLPFYETVSERMIIIAQN